jgi:hypothetical protein
MVKILCVVLPRTKTPLGRNGCHGFIPIGVNQFVEALPIDLRARDSRLGHSTSAYGLKGCHVSSCASSCRVMSDWVISGLERGLNDVRYFPTGGRCRAFKVSK